MATTEDRLERLFAKVRALPKARQELAVEALSEIAGEGTYQLSDNERAALEPALERAKRGEFASDADVDEVLNKPSRALRPIDRDSAGSSSPVPAIQGEKHEIRSQKAAFCVRNGALY